MCLKGQTGPHTRPLHQGPWKLVTPCRDHSLRSPFCNQEALPQQGPTSSSGVLLYGRFKGCWRSNRLRLINTGKPEGNFSHHGGRSISRDHAHHVSKLCIPRLCLDIRKLETGWERIAQVLCLQDTLDIISFKIVNTENEAASRIAEKYRNECAEFVTWW